MNTLRTSACAVSLLLLAAPSYAQSFPQGDWYVSVFGGYAQFQDYEFDFEPCCAGYALELGDGYVLGAAVGVNGLLGPNVRTEVELSHMSTDSFDAYGVPGGFVGMNPTGSISSTNLLVNAWFDIPTGGNIMPYVGGGIGAGFANGDLTITNGAGAQFDGSDTGLAYQLGFGASIPISTNGYVDVGYRYRVVNDIEFESSVPGFTTTAGDIEAHTLQIGARFNF